MLLFYSENNYISGEVINRKEKLNYFPAYSFDWSTIFSAHGKHNSLI